MRGELLLNHRGHLRRAIGDDERRAQNQLIRHVAGVEQLSGLLRIVAVPAQSFRESEMKGADDRCRRLGQPVPHAVDDGIYIYRQD